MRAHLEFNSGSTIVQLHEVVSGLVGGETDLSTYSTQLNLANCTIDATVPSPYVAYTSGDESTAGSFDRKCYALQTPTAEGYYRHLYVSWVDSSTSGYIYLAYNMHDTLGLVRDTGGHYGGGSHEYVMDEFGNSETTTNPNAFYLDVIIDANGNILITGDFSNTTSPVIGKGYIHFSCEHNNEVSVFAGALDKGCFTFDSYTLSKVLGTSSTSCNAVTEGRAYKFGSRGLINTLSDSVTDGTNNNGLMVEDRFLTVDKSVTLSSGSTTTAGLVAGYGHALFPSWLKFTHGDGTILTGDTVAIGADVYDVHSLRDYCYTTNYLVRGFFLVKQGAY